MEDLISQLPNDLLIKILLDLSTSEFVRTSVLSTRWRHLWKSFPGLRFNIDEHNDKDFLDRFLSLHEELLVYECTIMCYDVNIPCLKLLIDRVLTRRVQLLTIDGTMSEFMGLGMIELPVRFYMCETLVNLHLEHVKLDGFDGSEIINLPRLQVMNLYSVSIPSDTVLEMLITCSPNLQELRLSYIKMGFVRVRSETLKILEFRIHKNKRTGDGGGESRVVINTPNLEFLRINSDPLENFRVERVSSSIKLFIVLHFGGNDDFSYMQTLHKFFAGILRVIDFSMSGNTLHGICYAYSQVLQHQPLPKFKNLTSLYACFPSNFSEMLPMFLSSSPHLKSIDLELYGYPKVEEISNSPVPQCLQTSIENVKTKMMHMDDKERSPKTETEFAKYILHNAKALKKLTLWLEKEEDVCSSVLEQILAFRNCPSIDVKKIDRASNLGIGDVVRARFFRFVLCC